MSDSFPAPQPSGSPPPPPPPNLTPPPPWGAAQPGFGAMPAPPTYPPAGYAPYGATHGGAPPASTVGVRKATIVLFWVSSAAALILGVVAYHRGSVVDDFFNAGASLDDVESADARLAGLALLMLAAQIAAAITLAIWSQRTVSNAKNRGSEGSPGLAAGGWFIPIGNYWVPWGQLRKATRRFGTPPSSLTIWQLLFIAQAVLSVIARIVGNLDVLDTSADDAVTKLHNQGFLFMGTGVILAIATVVATRAMREVDALTTPSS